jgi:hypothetical protein
MSANPTLLTDIPDRVCADLKTLLPKLKKCKRIEGKFSIAELKKGGVAGPSVLVSLLGAKQDTTYSSSTPSFMMQMSAYVITRDTLKMSRDIAAAAICRVLIAHAGTRSSVALVWLILCAAKALWQRARGLQKLKPQPLPPRSCQGAHQPKWLQRA